LDFTNYILVIKPKTSFITPLQSDSLFGSLMWALKYLEGEEKLLEVLKLFCSAPPFLLSNAYPEGFLPKPLIPVFPDSKELEEADSKQLKEALKLLYIPESDFAEIVENLNSITLTDKLKFLYLSKNLKEDVFCKEVVLCKNVINRLTFATVEGGLYEQVEQFFNREHNYTIYIKINTSQTLVDEETLFRLFDYLSSFGFGKKKSAGKGHFEIIDFKQATPPFASKPNAFLSLSNFVPASTDPTEGFYELFVKYGKVGGDFALRSPWKKPLIMLKAGSVLKINGEVKPYYGRIVSEVYPPVNSVFHYGFAFPLGVRLS